MDKLEITVNDLKKKLEASKVIQKNHIQAAEDSKNQFLILKADRDEQKRVKDSHFLEGSRLQINYNELCELFNNQNLEFKHISRSKVK